MYGINRSSAVIELPEFDVTQQLPQDLMHVLLEGICALHLQQLLEYIVDDASLITLHEINSRICMYPYAYFSEKPASLVGFDLQGTQTGTIMCKLKYRCVHFKCTKYSCSNVGTSKYISIYSWFVCAYKQSSFCVLHASG